MSRHILGMKEDLLEYIAAQARNRDVFLLNYGAHFANFDFMIEGLRSVWARLGNEKDTSGHSHVGILPFVNILVRHAIFGFQHLASYQSFLAWLTFRPGLEAFLILGKWVDDPNNARTWKERQANRKKYKNAFSGQNLVSKCLPRSADFQKVLSRLNDDFLHPNPDFAYRHHDLEDQGSSFYLKIHYFDTDSDLHEANLMAYLNLLDQILVSSEGLINALFGPPPLGLIIRQPFAQIALSRATTLATQDTMAKQTMEEFGLWEF
jgi:hypothetical protein